MNDSLDAFRSPDVVEKVRSLSIRRKDTNSQNNNINKLKKQNDKIKLSNVNQKAPNNDDTMYNVEDLEFDNICHKKNEMSISKPNTSEQQLVQEKLFFNEKSSPQSGFCSICKKEISKENCSTHYATCLNRKFSLTSKTNVKLNDFIACSTCGKDIEISDYPSHSEACKQSNVEVARKLTNEIVTSSYFDTEAFPEKVPSGTFSCPSCSKDLTLLSTPLKTRHVNMCLDSSIQDSSASVRCLRSRGADDTTCTLCEKVFKTSRGLKIHLRTCTGKNDHGKPAKRKRKVRPPRNADEELIQLAKGMSASNRFAEKEIIKDEKRRKRELPIPVMLRSSDASRQVDLQARLDAMVTDIHVSDDVTSTPLLPRGNKWKNVAKQPQGSPIQSPDTIKVELTSSDSPPEDLNGGCGGADIEDDGAQAVDSAAEMPSASSKWKLGTRQNVVGGSYRVRGLLTQYVSNLSPEPKMTEISEDKDNSESGSQPFSSTLHQLINLDRDDDVSATSDPCGVQKEVVTCDPCEESREIVICDSSEDRQEVVTFDLCEERKDMVTRDSSEDGQESPKGSSQKDNSSANFSSVGLESSLRYRNTEGEPGSDPPGHSFLRSSDDDHPQPLTGRSLDQDLSKLINNETYSDMKITCQDGQLFLHKCFLMARCPKLLKIFEDGCDGDDSYHLSWCKVDDFKPLLTFIYTNRCENEKALEELYQKLICSTFNPPQDLHESTNQCNGGLGLVDSLSYDRDEKPSVIIAHDTPMVSLHSSPRVLSDDDLFSSFTMKPHDTSRDSGHHITTKSCDDLIDSTYPQCDDVAKSPSNERSDESILEINQSDCVFVAADSSRDVHNSTPCSQEWFLPVTRSQPGHESGRVHFDDVPLSLPVDPCPREHSAVELSVNDSLLLQTALGFDQRCARDSFKTPRRRKEKMAITPMPNFSAMETPEIIDRGRKIGLKKSLGKKKVKIKLKELHAYTHQLESDGETPGKGDYVAATNSSAGSRHNTDGDLTEAHSSSTNRQVEIESARSFLDSLPDEDFESLFHTALSLLHREGVLLKALKREQEFMKGIPSGSKQDLLIWDQRLTPDSNLVEISSSDDDDGSDVERLHATLFQDLTQQSDVEIESRESKQPIRRKLTDEDVEKKMFDLILADRALHTDILQYRPIRMSRIRTLMKDSSLKCSSDLLLNYLDRQGVTFTTADERKPERKYQRKKRKKAEAK